MRNNNCTYMDENGRSSLHQPSELSAVKVCYFKAFIQSELYSVQFSASLYSERINCTNFSRTSYYSLDVPELISG